METKKIIDIISIEIDLQEKIANSKKQELQEEFLTNGMANQIHIDIIVSKKLVEFLNKLLKSIN